MRRPPPPLTAPPTRPRARRRRGILVLMLACALGGCGPQGGDGRPLPEARALGLPGDAPGAFVKPRCLADDGATLWVIDRSGRVQRFDPQSGRCVQWFRLQETRLGFPTGLTVAPSPAGDGRPALWIADTHNQRVLVYEVPPLPPAPTSEPQELPLVPIAQFGSYGLGPGQFIFPTSVAVLTQADGRTIDRVYVGEFGGNDRVQVFDAAFRPIGSFGRPGTGADPADVQFQRPQSIVIDARRQRLIIADSINHRLGLFTYGGRLERWIDGSGEPDPADSGKVVLRHPRGLRLLPDGTLLVVEFGANRVTRVDLDRARALGRWGRAGRGPGDLAEPWALALLGSRAYVADALNHRLVEFALN